MSMNLNAKDKHGQTVHLWQTPTWVSYMCINSWKKNKKGYYKQRHWKDTRKLYLDWCKSRCEGRSFTYDPKKGINELKDCEDNLKEHVEYIMSFKKLKFWVM